MSVKEITKTWLTFFLVLVPGTFFIVTVGICALLRKIVRVLALLFRRNELTSLATGFDRIFCWTFDPAIFEKDGHIINIVLVIKGRLELETLQKEIQARVLDYRDETGNLVYARAQQFPTRFLGYDFYQWENNFKLSGHVKYCDEFTAKNLNTFIPSRERTPFGKYTSPWEILIGRNYDDDRNTGIYFRFHHSMSDGISLLEILNSRLSTSSENKVIVQKSKSKIPIQSSRSSSCITGFYDNFISVPRRFLLENGSHQNLSAAAANDQNIDLRFFIQTTGKIELNALKQAKERLGISLTNLITTAIASSLSDFVTDWKAQHGDQTDYNSLVGVLALDRPGVPTEKLQNYFDKILLNLPTNPSLTVPERANFILEQFSKIKTSAESKVMGLIVRLADYVPICLHRKLIVPPRGKHPGVLITNLPISMDGSTFLAHEIQDVTFWVSTGLNTFWITFSVYSFKGYLKVACTGAARVVGNENALEKVSARIETVLRSQMI